MTMLSWKKRWAVQAMMFATVCCGLSMPAQAGVTIAGTRVIYPAQQREVAVKLNNPGAQPALVQVWVDDGDPKQSPDTSKAPFLVSPPVVRIEAGKGQTLRLVYGPTSSGTAAPAGRESVYWLNVLEVPPSVNPAAANPSEVDQNHLQVAFRTRIKVFLRPQGLAGDPE
ncbi:MAG: fimbrial biogenesis chaperone, partial [Lysobacter sp.]